MVFRAESDIPIPRGRTVSLETTLRIEDSLSFDDKFNFLVPNAMKKRRDVLVAMMTSNCYAESTPNKYVKALQKYMKVDIYGGCASTFSDG